MNTHSLINLYFRLCLIAVWINRQALTSLKISFQRFLWNFTMARVAMDEMGSCYLNLFDHTYETLIN